MNILVVDDDKLVAMSLRMIIEADPDMTVVDVGYSAADAIRLYERKGFASAYDKTPDKNYMTKTLTDKND